MTPAIEVTIARASDAAEIARMSRDLIEHGLPWTWDRDRVARAIAATHTNVAVVREHQDLVGFGIMEYRHDEAHLVLFAVRPTNQRQGLGTFILNWLEACASVSGAQRIRVEARRDNNAARNFYSELGYHEMTIERRMYSDALDGIRLQKWLRTSDTR